MKATAPVRILLHVAPASDLIFVTSRFDFLARDGLLGVYVMTAESLSTAAGVGHADAYDNAYAASSDDVARARVEDAFLAADRVADPRGLSRVEGGIKRAMDLLIAVPAVVFFAPLMAVIYLLVRRDGGPGIFVQRRLGKDGALFPCFKFRSMIPNAERQLHILIGSDEQLRKDWEGERKLKDDPRVTRLGAFLRRKSLDELPQLFNVLRGEMSIVGPRPINPDERGKYGAYFGSYAAIRPGLTGLWQVSGRNDVSYERRVELDVAYAARWSLRRDIDIIVKTVEVVVSGRGAL